MNTTYGSHDFTIQQNAWTRYFLRQGKQTCNQLLEHSKYFTVCTFTHTSVYINRIHTCTS